MSSAFRYFGGEPKICVAILSANSDTASYSYAFSSYISGWTIAYTTHA